MKKYRTIDMARIARIHPNTVRKYEELGFISEVPRAKNGYREYRDKHVYQIKVCRSIFDYGWVGKEIRKASLKIIYAMVEWDLQKALTLTREYLELIDKEYRVALETANILKKWVDEKEYVYNSGTYNRREAAELIGVTPETLRSWERNGLINVPRVGVNSKRVYGYAEIERLRIIYMLKQAKFSINAIFRSLKQYDEGNTSGIIGALNTPDPWDSTSWIHVGDKWIKSLEDVVKGGNEILDIIEEVSRLSQ